MPIFEPTDYYSAIGKYWDRMYTDKIEYQGVYNFVESIRIKRDYAKEIADVACGTGYLLKIFKDSGYRVFGSDLNAKMLEEAKQKLPYSDLLQASYDEVVLPGKFPLIISFFNSFAYCLDKESLTSTLSHLYDQLNAEGMIFFDLFVTDNLKEEFSIKTFTFGDGTHISRTFFGYPINDTTYHSYFVYTIFENKKPKTITTDSLRGILTKEEIIQSIKEAGFELFYDGQNPGIPDSQNSIMFVGIKKG